MQLLDLRNAIQIATDQRICTFFDPQVRTPPPPSLCVDWTQSCETGEVWGLRWRRGNVSALGIFLGLGACNSPLPPSMSMDPPYRKQNHAPPPPAPGGFYRKVANVVHFVPCFWALQW